jgi:hypothetical protein
MSMFQIDFRGAARDLFAVLGGAAEWPAVARARQNTTPIVGVLA